MTALDARCGTTAGYKAHWKKREEICCCCRNAWREYGIQYHAANRERDLARGAEYRAKNRLKINERRAAEYAANPEKAKERARYHALSNPEKRRIAHKKWRLANPEKVKARSSKYKAENREKVLAAKAVYHAKNADKSREQVRRRRAKRLANGFAPYTEQQVLELYGLDCHICHKPVDLSASRRIGHEGWQQGLHIEHVIPIIHGGPDTIENVRPSHGLCNLKKAA